MRAIDANVAAFPAACNSGCGFLSPPLHSATSKLASAECLAAPCSCTLSSDWRPLDESGRGSVPETHLPERVYLHHDTGTTGAPMRQPGKLPLTRLAAFVAACTATCTAVLLLSSCMTISGFDITGGQLTVFRTIGGAEPVAQAPAALTAAQRQMIGNWLAAHRAGWSSRYAQTLIPAWCLRLDAPSDKAVSLCRYGKTVVLRGLGPEMERTLSASDEALFALELEGGLAG